MNRRDEWSKTMPDKDYICLSTGKTIAECDLYICPKCGEYSCPYCGSEVETIENYDRNMEINLRERK